jgi:hypothetical protein
MATNAMPFKSRLNKYQLTTTEERNEFRRAQVFEDKFSGAFVMAFEETIRKVERQIGPQAIETAANSLSPNPILMRMREDDLAGLIDIQKVSDKPFEDLAAELIAEMMLRKGKSESQRFGFEMSFTLDNPYTMPWIAQNRRDLLAGISNASRKSVVLAIEDGVRDNMTTREIAANIRQSIGLTPSQSRTLRKFRASLGAQGESMTRISNLAKARRTRMIRQRAQMIARTEVNRINANAKQHAWWAARDQGLLKADTKRRWVASPLSPRTDEQCISLHNSEPVGLDENFKDFNGNEFLTPPAHPGCRCTMSLVIEPV